MLKTGTGIKQKLSATKADVVAGGEPLNDMRSGVGSWVGAGPWTENPSRKVNTLESRPACAFLPEM